MARIHSRCPRPLEYYQAAEEATRRNKLVAEIRHPQMAMESGERGFGSCFTFQLSVHCLRMSVLLRLNQHRLLLELRCSDN
jgi:hypothetical protein